MQWCSQFSPTQLQRESALAFRPCCAGDINGFSFIIKFCLNISYITCLSESPSPSLYIYIYTHTYTHIYIYIHMHNMIPVRPPPPLWREWFGVCLLGVALSVWCGVVRGLGPPGVFGTMVIIVTIRLVRNAILVTVAWLMPSCHGKCPLSQGSGLFGTGSS